MKTTVVEIVRVNEELVKGLTDREIEHELEKEKAAEKEVTAKPPVSKKKGKK